MESQLGGMVHVKKAGPTLTSFQERDGDIPHSSDVRRTCHDDEEEEKRSELETVENGEDSCGIPSNCMCRRCIAEESKRICVMGWVLPMLSLPVVAGYVVDVVAVVDHCR